MVLHLGVGLQQVAEGVTIVQNVQPTRITSLGASD